MTADLYTFTLSIFIITLAILLRQHLSLKVVDKLSRYFNAVLVISILFCIIDLLWGLGYFHLIPANSFVVSVFTYVYHIFALVMASGWYMYTSAYLEFEDSLFMKVLVLIPFVAGMVLLYLNYTTGILFNISSDMEYHVGPLRMALFAMELFYVLAAFARTLVRLSAENDTFKKSRYKVVLTYLIVLLGFGIAQLFFVIAPIYSASLMISALIVFIGNITTEREKRLLDKSDYYMTESRESFRALSALAEAYISIHVIDLVNNTTTEIRSPHYVEPFIRLDEGADMQIRRAMEAAASPEMEEEITEFVDLSTLRERLKDKTSISHEFISRYEGWCLSTFTRMEEDVLGEPTKVLHAVLDIDEGKRKELEYQEALKVALENKNEIYAEMLRMQAGGIVASDDKGQLIFINDAAAKMFGYTTYKEVGGSYTAILEKMESEQKEELPDSLRRVVKEGTKLVFYFSTADYKDRQIYARADVRRLQLKNGSNIVITSLTDMTANKEIEDKLTVLSETDALTGIRNRGSGESLTIRELKNGVQGMFCLVDANNFKHINDTYGHQAGDKALIVVADTLRASFRDDDIVMRLGGDEFAVFAKTIMDKQLAQTVIRRFFDRLSSVSIDELNGEKLTVSLGAVFTEGDGQDSFEQLYSRADSVMYLCKKEKNTSNMAFYEVH